MPMEFEKVLASISAQMNIEFRDLTSQFQHRGMKGEAREIIVRQFLQKYLPKSLGIGHGEIVSAIGQVSKEMDVVIYDGLKCPILYEKGDIQVFPSEGVYCVIQVKSHLDSIALVDCIENIKSAKDLPKVAYIPQKGAIINVVYLYGKEYDHFPTMGVVLAFDSINLKELRKTLESKNKEKNLTIEQQIDMICILNKGIIANVEPNESFSSTPTPDSKLAHCETDRSLLLFYLGLIRVLSQTWVPPINLGKYIQNLEVKADSSD